MHVAQGNKGRGRMSADSHARDDCDPKNDNNDGQQGPGYLKVGQPVEVKVGAFPYQRYGSLKGTLISISPDAEDKNAASRDTDTRAGAGSQQSDPSRDPANTSPNAGYVYKVHIRTEASRFVVDGEPRPIGAGMTVQADITTDRRRVIDFFLSPVVKYLDEGMKVR